METIVAQAIPAVYIDVFQIIQNCNYSFNHTATGDIEIIKQLYSITFSISFLFYAEVFIFGF